MTAISDPFGVSIDKYFKREFTEVQLDLNKYFLNRDIHVTGSWQEPLFSALDVAKYIGDDENYLRVIKTQLRKDIDYIELTPEGRSKTIYLKERGLYRYLMHSNRPKAVEFQDHVCEIIHKLRVDGMAIMKDRITEVAFEAKLREDRYKRAITQQMKMEEELATEHERNDMLESGCHRVFERNSDHTHKDMADHYIKLFIYEYKFRMREDNNPRNRYLPLSFKFQDIPEDLLRGIRKEALEYFRGRNDDGMWSCVCEKLDKFLVKKP